MGEGALVRSAEKSWIVWKSQSAAAFVASMLSLASVLPQVRSEQAMRKSVRRWMDKTIGEGEDG